MKNRGFIIFLVVVLLLIAGALYYHYSKGGFNDVEVTRVTSDEHLIIGQEYLGKATDEKYAARLEQMEKLLEADFVDGDVAAIYYQDPSNHDGVMNAFIGIKVANSSLEIPEDMELRRWGPHEVVRATKEANFTHAGTLYGDIEDFAEENDLRLTEESLEIYYEDDLFVVEMKIADQ